MPFMTGPSHRPLFEPMEARILHSVDIAPLLLESAAVNAYALPDVTGSLTESSVQRSEIVFVDSAVPDSGVLLADLQAQRDAGRAIEIVRIAEGVDGVALITATLAGRSDISAVHVIAHGADGQVQLGSVTLNSQTLMTRAGEVSSWGSALTQDADLLLYGCDVAQTALGQRFANDLAALTGADVAASVDLTGATALGGNWVLEAQTGAIDTAMLLGPLGTAWQGVFNITTAPGQTLANTTTSGSQATTPSSRQVTIHSDGSFVAVWTSADASSNGVYMRRFDAGGSPLSAEILVNTHTPNDQQNPAIAMDSAGNFVVVWESKIQDGDDYGIYAQRFNINATTIGGETLVNSTTANDQTSPSVAMSATGDFVVTWTSKGQDSGSTDGVYAKQFIGGVWGTEFRVNSTTSNDQFDPAVAMNKATGDFVIVWTSKGQDSGSTDGVYGRLFNAAGAEVKSEFRINATQIGNQNMADVAMNNSGAFVVVIADDLASLFLQPALGTGIYAYSFNSSGVVQNSNALVNQYSAGDQRNPSVAIDGSGDFVVVWESPGQDGSNYGIVARHFKANNAAYQDEKLINVYTDGVQNSPSVAWNGSQAVFLWSGKSAGDSTGVSFRLATISSGSNTQPAITSNGGLDVAVVSISENTTAVTTVTATDADLPAQTLTFSLVSIADHAKFSLNSSTGVLVFSAAPDFENPLDANGDNVYEVTVQVSDGSLVATQAISVTVTNVNEAPTATNLSAAQSYTEDTALALTLIVISDVDSANVTATLTLSAPGAGSLNTATSGAVTSTYNAGTGVWSASGAIADVNALLGALSFTPTLNYNANFSMATSVSDGVAAPITGSKVMTGTAVNDAPFITSDGAGANASVVIPENSTYVTQVTASDVDLPAQTLTYAIVPTASGGGADAARFTIDAATGVLRFVLPPNYEVPGDAGADNVYNVTVQVSDGTLTDIQAIAVSVTNVAETVVSAADQYTLSEDQPFSATVASGWYDAAWSTRNFITINNSSGPALTGTVVLVTLNTGTVDYTRIQSAGQDLRFIDIDGTVLDHEIETWNPAGTSRIWVRVPSIDAASSTDGLWLYYGNTTAPAGQNAAGVWGSASAVLHMGTTLADSSLSANTVTQGATTGSTGLIGEARVFNGTTSYVDVGSAAAVDNLFTGGGAVSAWIRPTGWGEGGFGRVAAKASDLVATAGWAFQLDSVNQSLIFEYGFSGQQGRWRAPVGAISLDTWQHVAVVYDSGSSANVPVIYINGVAVALTVSSVPSGTPTSDAARSLTVGNHTSASPDRTFAGAIDEFRAFSTSLTTAQVNADYRAGTGALVSLGALQTAAPGVLNNDTSDLMPLTATRVTGPAYASAFTLNADGTFNYTLNPDFAGSDSFTYVAHSGSVTGTVTTVLLNVVAVNDAPVANDDVASTNHRVGIDVNVKANDTDVDNPVASLSVTVIGSSAGTTATLNGDNSIHFDPGLTTGLQTVTYRLSDGSLNSNVATLTINVAANAPPDSADASATFDEDTGYTFKLSDFAFTDSDPGQTLAGLRIDVLPSSGTLRRNGLALAATDVLSVADIVANQFSFTHAANDNGLPYASFRFSVQDNLGGFDSTPNVFTLNVTPVNDAPTTGPVTLTVIAEGSGGRVITQAELLANAADVDGPSLTAIGLAISSGSGSLINNGDGTWSYTPALNDDTSVAFSYGVADGSLSVAGSATLDITPVNDPPTAVLDSAMAVEAGRVDNATVGSAATGNVLDNDTDPDVGDTKTVTTPGSIQGLYGLFTLNGNGSFTYVVDDANATVQALRTSGDTLSESFGYTMQDTAGATSSAILTVTITGVNDAPKLATPVGDVAVQEGVPLLFQIPAATFGDVDSGDTLVYAAAGVGGPLPAWLSFDSSTRGFSGVPLPGDVGNFAVRVTATDALGASAMLQFQVQVSAAPVVVPPTPVDTTPPTPIETPAPAEVPETPIVTEEPVAPPAPVDTEPPQPAQRPEAPVLAIVEDESLAVSAPLAAVVAQAAPSATAAVSPPAPPVAAEVTQSPLLASVTNFIDGFQGVTVSGAVFSANANVGSSFIAPPVELTSKADVVLAVAVVNELTGISFSSISQSLQNTELLSQLTEMRTQLQALGEERHTLIASSIAVSSSLSIGYVIWLVRGGVLVSSMLSALPAWQLIDPLPVLAAAGGKKRKAASNEGDDQEFERLFDEAEPVKAELPPPDQSNASDAKKVEVKA